MSTLKTSYIPSARYNGLPTIHEVADVSDYKQDCDDLSALIGKHSLPIRVQVRLIHKHSDTLENEVMVVRSIIKGSMLGTAM